MPEPNSSRRGWRLLAHVRNACKSLWKPLTKTTRNPNWYDPNWFEDIQEDDSFVADPFALHRAKDLGISPDEYTERKRAQRVSSPVGTEVASSSGKPKQGEAERKFKGVRQISNGKWVTEIRPTRSIQRVWVGTYESKEAAARAYDVATFYYKEEHERKVYNFGDPSDFVPALPPPQSMLGLSSDQKKSRVKTLAGNAAKRAEGTH